MFTRHRTNFRQRTEEFDRTLFSLLFSTFLSSFYNCPCAEQYFSKSKMVFTPRSSIFEHTGYTKNLTSIIGVQIFESQIPEHFSLGSLRLKVSTQIRQHFYFFNFLLLMVDISPPPRSLCVVGKLGREKEPGRRREDGGRLVAWLRPWLNHQTPRTG